MEIAPKRTVTVRSAGEKWRFWNLCDFHLGNESVDEALAERVVEAIRKDPHSLWVGAGDYCECITKTDPRFSAGTLAPWIGTKDIDTLLDSQKKRACQLLRPIAGKCLGLVRGNHENKALKVNGVDVTKDIADTLRVPDLKLTGYIPVVFHSIQRGNSQVVCRIVVLHGRCHATTKAGRMTYLNRQAQQWECDLLFMGHVHDAMATPVPRIGVNAAHSDVKAFTTLAMFSGGYLKGYELHKENYIEEATYSPTALGPWAVDVRVLRKGGGLRADGSRDPERYTFEMKVIDPDY